MVVPRGAFAEIGEYLFRPRNQRIAERDPRMGADVRGIFLRKHEDHTGPLRMGLGRLATPRL